VENHTSAMKQLIPLAKVMLLIDGSLLLLFPTSGDKKKMENEGKKVKIY
jgi:hypothetical protein